MAGISVCLIDKSCGGGKRQRINWPDRAMSALKEAKGLNGLRLRVEVKRNRMAILPHMGQWPLDILFGEAGARMGRGKDENRCTA